jgi:glyoxylase I family protein
MNGVRALRMSFLGVRTEQRAALRDLFETVLGMDAFFEGIHFDALRLADGSVVEIFAEDDEAHAHFDTGPVVGFEVDDLDAAEAVLSSKGVQILGDIVEGSKGSRWLHFRGPDGHVYELLESSARSPGSHDTEGGSDVAP